MLAERSKDTHDAAILSLFAGLRAGEIHSLTWADIDFANGTIYIKDPKNKHSRYAFITPEIAAVLRSRVEEGKTGLIFPSTVGTRREAVSDSFERAVKVLGLNNHIVDSRQKVVFHTLRHTFASWLVQRGTPLYTVAELMGHTSLEMTKRYAHLAPDTMRQAAMGLFWRITKKRYGASWLKSKKYYGAWREQSNRLRI
ncbi:MAG: site-specific integrase [Bilophila sp.]